MSKIQLPDIDYSTHPNYLGLKKDESTQATALNKLFGELSETLENECKILQAQNRTLKSKAYSIKKIFNETFGFLKSGYKRKLLLFNKNGIHPFHFSPHEKVKLQELVKPFKIKLDKIRNKKDPKRRGVEGSSIPLYRKSQFNLSPKLTSHVKSLLKNGEVFKLANDAYNLNYYLAAITLQINNYEDKSITQNCTLDGKLSPLHYLHIDSTSGTLKILFYLNEVTEENGPFRFTPGSHKSTSLFTRAIMKATDKAGFDGVNDTSKINFSSLPHLFQKKANFGNDLFGEDESIKQIQRSEIKYTSQDGDAIFFDTNGFHRGNIEYGRGKREILQIRLNPKLKSRIPFLL